MDMAEVAQDPAQRGAGDLAETADDAARRSRESRLNKTLGVGLRMLRAHSMDAVAEVALRQAQTRLDRPRIVVVGETKRGKSSLVNALVGEPGLSPVGADETSATYLSIVPLDPPVTEPWAEMRAADGTRTQIAMTEIADYVDLSRLSQSARALPVGVEVHVPPGPLGDVVVTDCPGIGGIGGVRGRMSQRLVAETGCLLFVIDAGAPISAGELDYLQACATSVEHLIVCVTMIDKYPETWLEIVDGVARELTSRSSRLGRFPVVGVSAPAAMAAQTASTAAVEEILLKASGLPVLIEHVRKSDPREFLPSVNALRTCRTGLADALKLVSLRERMQSESEGPGVDAELLARKEELLALRTQEQRWTLDLDRDLGRMRAEIARDLTKRLGELSQTWRARIEKTPLTGRKAYVQATSLDMATEYQLLRRDMADAAAASLDTILRRMFGDSLPAEVELALTAPSLLAKAEEQAAQPRSNPFDPTLIMTASLGTSIATRLGAAQIAGGSLAGFLGPLALPLAAAGAGAWVAFNWAYRSNRLERQNLTTELNRTLASERSTIMDQLETRVRELKPELVMAYREHLRRSVASVQGLLQEAEKAKSGSEQRRKAVAAESGRASRELRELLKDVDDALALVHR